MKTKMQLALVLMLGFITVMKAQNVSTRTNEFEVDFSDPKKLVNSTVPTINWIAPVAETNYAQDPKFKIKFNVESASGIKNITLAIKESHVSSARGAQMIQPSTEVEKHIMAVERNVTLMDGGNVVEVIVENEEGVKTFSQRSINIGTTALTDANKLDRTDYAILFTTNDYDNWPDLINPVNDGRMVADELKKNYGFKVEIMEGGSQSDILKKLH